jgi:hypothetical protein
MRVNTPTEGLKSTSHINEATATEVATVDEKMVRNTPMPRIALLASTARPTPSTQPERDRQQDELHGHPEGMAELLGRGDVGVLLEAHVHLVAAEEVVLMETEVEGAAEWIEDERAEQHQRRQQHEQREQASVTAIAAHPSSLEPVTGSKWWPMTGERTEADVGSLRGHGHVRTGTRTTIGVPSSSTHSSRGRSWPRASTSVTRAHRDPSVSSVTCSGRTPRPCAVFEVWCVVY